MVTWMIDESLIRYAVSVLWFHFILVNWGIIFIDSRFLVYHPQISTDPSGS